MALVLADRVKETSTTTGTGTLTLAGAAVGFRSFSVIGNGNTCYYTITNQAVPAEWEVGIGTYTLSGTTLARTTILASSNAGSVVTLSAGTKDVFVTYPAGKAIYQDANGAYIPASPVFNGNAIISDNSANAALRITQIGAGNAILVEDSANPDATPFVVTADGKVGAGTTTPTASLEVVSPNPSAVARASSTAGSAVVGAFADDYYSTPTYRGTFLNQYSSTATGTTLGFANANLGYLAFQNTTSNALIYTNGGTGIVFGTTSIDRGRVAADGVWSLGAAPGAESLRVTPVASAVNYLELKGNIAGSAPQILAGGTDSGIGINLSTKGTGVYGFFTNSFAIQQFAITRTTASVNYLSVTGAATGAAPVMSAVGSDTNINLTLTPKGTGSTYSPTFAASNGMVLNNATINTSYTLPTGYNALSAGPVTIAAGVVVTVPSGSVWAIV